jgi:hypothetical protein
MVMGTKISTSWSVVPDTYQAVKSAYEEILSDLGGAPDLLIVYSSVTYDSQVLANALQNLAPGVPVHGSTSCLGVMTAAGFHTKDGIGLGLFAIADEDGDYGVGVALVDDDPRASGAEAIQKAINNADRPGEPPELVWINGVPGHEEAVLEGIQDILGPDVPIAGGSSADNTVEGYWQQFANGQIYTNAVIVTAMYPSTNTYLAFHSGYSPSATSGQVTKSEGRTLYEIDGRSAAQVYNEWTGGVISDNLEGGNVLAATSLYPLGRQVGQVGQVPYHRLSHPDSVTADGALTLFSNIEEGEELILMNGTRKSLISRAGRVARAALGAGQLTSDQISGALVIYCAGCMLTVQDKMEEVAAEVGEALGGKPFMGAFTFGEQGCFTGGENRHGNLMISVVVFEKGEDD